MRHYGCLATAAILGSCSLALAQPPTRPAAPTNPWLPARPASGSLLQRRAFFSKTIAGQYGYLIYLPTDYKRTPSKRFPVLYYLHGTGGEPSVAQAMVERLDVATRAGKAPSMIVVSCTDASRQNLWCDSKDGKYPVETIIIKELIDHVDSSYRTVARREGRTLEGFSMGSIGAARLALKYPDRFCAFSIMSTAMPTAERLRDWQPEMFQQISSGDLEYVRVNLPWALAGQNVDRVRGRLRIRIHAGANDPLKTGCEEFHDYLNTLRIDHEFSLVPDAGHNLAEMYAHLPGDPFAFYTSLFRDLTAAGSQPASSQPPGG